MTSRIRGPETCKWRVHAVGICGSDVHYFSEGTIGDTVCVYPMVLGHEPTGEIVKTGAGVNGWSAGDHAVLEPAIYCYHCEYCLSGHHNVCANLKFLSTPGLPGFFREFVNLPAKSLMPIPRPMDMMQSTLFEPLAVVLHSLSFASVGQGETVAVFGAGPIGLLDSGRAEVERRRPRVLRGTAAASPRTCATDGRRRGDRSARGRSGEADCVRHRQARRRCGIRLRHQRGHGEPVPRCGTQCWMRLWSLASHRTCR